MGGHGPVSLSSPPTGLLQGGRPWTPNVAVPSWSSYGHDPQHTAISDVPARPLTSIRWQTPVDLNPNSYYGELYIHYGSPLVTAANTVIVPVKTGLYDCFEVKGFDGGTGALKWTVIERIIWGWILTFPAAGGLAYGLLWSLELLGWS